ncbi:MAG: methyltransferase domain-containing protein [Myxococcota bacterium]
MADLFEHRAKDYDARPLPQQISEGVFRALESKVRLKDDLQVMDFGAGTGLIAGKVAPRVDKIIAVDISQAMLAQLARKADLEGKVQVECRDLFESPLDTQVDLIVSAMALHHVRDTPRLLATFHDHLRPGGRVALADLDAEDGTFHPPGTEGVFHHGFDRDEFRGQLATAGFEEVELVTACEVEREGRSYPIFLAVARRP